MSWPRRVVFDTSTLVGAALKPGSLPHQALMLALARCDVCASVPTWLELERVMRHERLDRFLPRDVRLEFVVMLRTSMHFFPVTQADVDTLQPTCRDVMDNKFLALVQVCRADMLVSSDEDLLVLHPWCGVPVCRAAEFLPGEAVV